MQKFYLTWTIAARVKSADDEIQFVTELTPHLQRVAHAGPAGAIRTGRHQGRGERAAQCSQQWVIGDPYRDGRMLAAKPVRAIFAGRHQPGGRTGAGLPDSVERSVVEVQIGRAILDSATEQNQAFADRTAFDFEDTLHAVRNQRMTAESPDRVGRIADDRTAG